ncbi:hypothetical protein QJS10_CPB13g00373 [Acorus calamus]|uniref:Reverse transcriptase n=1 Tax=Acorus calamus TaxID=4465 RepID=A0AAV9DFD6_ACOCL|nr:hypothetical protein QJS10_CPB13g00373 [Acorus calamus]
MVQVLPRHISDHSPIVVYTDLPPPQGWKPFRFERFWFAHQELEDIVRTHWAVPVQSSPMGRLHQRLIKLQKPLRRWNNTKLRDLPNRFKEAQKHLETLLLEEQQRPPTENNMNQVRMASNYVAALQTQLETFWSQRARSKWVKEGDRNTRFFHSSVQHRRVRNRITSLRTEEGEILSDTAQIRGTPSKLVEEFNWTARKRGADKIKELVQGKLAQWKAQLLTMAGRIQLLRAVITAIPQHLMMAAAMSNSAISSLEKMMRKFLWGLTEQQRDFYYRTIIFNRFLHLNINGKETHGRLQLQQQHHLLGEFYAKD